MAKNLAAEKKWVYPTTIGFAVDLTIPAVSIPVVTSDLYILLYLADLLLLYDTILIRSDFLTSQILYSGLTVEELEPLVNGGRLRFFAANAWSRTAPVLDRNSSRPTSEYFRQLYDYMSFTKDLVISDPKRVVRQIEANSVPNQELEADSAAAFQQEMEQSLRPEIDQLPTPFGEDIDYHVVGFRNGIDRILDIWSTGTLEVYLDPQMLGYMEFSDITRSEVLGKLANELGNPVDVLHTISHLPTVTEMIVANALDKDGILRLVQSADATKLRNWLKENLEPDMDVRDSYFRSLRQLPSKKLWAGWLRFGSVSLLTTGLSLLLSGNPALAALLGLAVGATNQAIGKKLTQKLLDPYHPKQWLSGIQSKTKA